MAKGQVVLRAPVTRLYPAANMCGLDVDQRIKGDANKMNRLKLMLAAAYEGVEVTGNENSVVGPGDLIMHKSDFIGSMDTLMLPSVLKRLSSLVPQPVRQLERGPKVMQWLLVLRFRAQRAHMAELERLPEIHRAVPSLDRLYDGHLVELFVPEGFLLPDGRDASVTEGSDQIVDDGLLRKRVVEALSFDLS